MTWRISGMGVRMFELGIVGNKNSGKTTLIESLLPLLTDLGCRVGTIKHTSHQHSFDTKGKDTCRHRAAGAVMTMAVSSGELALFCGDTALHETIITQVMTKRCDLCLVEGDRTASRPMIFLTRGFNRERDTVPDNVLASYGPVSLSDEIPHFTLDGVEELAKFIFENAMPGGSR